jgi:hypothetical protein
LNSTAAAEVDSIAEIGAEEVNANLSFQMYQLKMELNEMKGKLGEVIQEIQEAKKEIKEEIARANKVVAPVLTCNIC